MCQNFPIESDVMYKPSVVVDARVSFEPLGPALLVIADRLRLSAPPVLPPKGNIALARRCGPGARRHVAIWDRRDFADRGFDRSAAQQNIFAIAALDFSIF